MASKIVPPPTSAQVAPGLLADRAYEWLCDQIVTLQIPPGQPIDEDSVEGELGIGRTPIREAIKRLALEGLVAIFPRRGTFASEINIADLTQISDVRAPLESHAARRAAERLTSAGRSELLALDAELEAASSEAAQLMDLDRRVHDFIYRSANNSYLAGTCSAYFNLSLRIWYLAIDRMPGFSGHVQEQREILAAIAGGDADGAAALLGAHVRKFEQSVRSVF
jgi:DNA-binding GntR family transcriptional regulator